MPGAIGDEDRRPVDAAEAKRLASIVEAAWTVFDRVAAKAPEELRKGPRGGGRDRTKIVGHVNDADGGYATVMGIKIADVRARRATMLDVLRQPSDGSPIAGRKWPPRYAARRIAWHALDHAWEIEDRTEPRVSEATLAAAGTAPLARLGARSATIVHASEPKS